MLLSDVFATLKRKLFRRDWAATDKTYAAFMAVIHGMCLLAPFTFSWSMFTLFVVTYILTGCLGITLSFHRQLSHRSFATPKWLEYALAYCGVMAVQGDPIEWASSHRYHHLHTDTPLDPHSPYEGFWWSHMGWLLDNEVRSSLPSLAQLFSCLIDIPKAHVGHIAILKVVMQVCSPPCTFISDTCKLCKAREHVLLQMRHARSHPMAFILQQHCWLALLFC